MADNRPPTPCEVLAAIGEAQKALDDWAGHVAAFRDARQAGQVLAASRAADVATATLIAAACDTRSLARAATDDALPETA